jgi:hypothetical protein
MNNRRMMAKGKASAGDRNQTVRQQAVFLATEPPRLINFI